MKDQENGTLTQSSIDSGHQPSLPRWRIDLQAQAIEMGEIVLSGPDPAWRHRDANGHAHRWRLTKKGQKACRQSWEYIEPESYEDNGCYCCRKCGEIIYPGMRYKTVPEMKVVGVQTWSGLIELAKRPRIRGRRFQVARFCKLEDGTVFSGLAVWTSIQSEGGHVLIKFVGDSRLTMMPARHGV